MSGDSTIDYQTVSSRSGLRYDVQGRQISWNGKPAHAQYFFVKKPEESAQPLSEIVNHLKIGICTYWVYDDGKIQMNYMSDGYYDLVQSTRKKRERFEGCNVLNAVCDEDRQRVAALVLAASEQRRSFQIRFRVVLDDNSRKQLQMQGTFIRRETGRSVYYCAVGGANECYMSGEE